MDEKKKEDRPLPLFRAFYDEVNIVAKRIEDQNKKDQNVYKLFKEDAVFMGKVFILSGMLSYLLSSLNQKFSSFLELFHIKKTQLKKGYSMKKIIKNYAPIIGGSSFVTLGMHYFYRVMKAKSSAENLIRIKNIQATLFKPQRKRDPEQEYILYNLESGRYERRKLIENEEFEKERRNVLGSLNKFFAERGLV